MDKLKNFAKGVEKFLLRDTLQFFKNRFKEKTSIVAMILGVGSTMGYNFQPELVSSIIDAVMLASGLDTTLTTANVVQGIVVSSIATFLTPTSKIKVKLKK